MQRVASAVIYLFVYLFFFRAAHCQLEGSQIFEHILKGLAQKEKNDGADFRGWNVLKSLSRNREQHQHSLILAA